MISSENRTAVDEDEISYPARTPTRPSNIGILSRVAMPALGHPVGGDRSILTNVKGSATLTGAMTGTSAAFEGALSRCVQCVLGTIVRSRYVDGGFERHQRRILRALSVGRYVRGTIVRSRCSVDGAFDRYQRRIFWAVSATTGTFASLASYGRHVWSSSLAAAIAPPRNIHRSSDGGQRCDVGAVSTTVVHGSSFGGQRSVSGTLSASTGSFNSVNFGRSPATWALSHR
jgi:hypothetical protein